MPVSMLIALLAQTGLQVFTQIHGNSNNLTLVSSLIPVVQQIADSISKLGTALAQAQAEAWPEGDKRYLPLFAEAHAAIAAAEATL